MLISKLQHLASYVSCHNAMANDMHMLIYLHHGKHTTTSNRTRISGAISHCNVVHHCTMAGHGNTIKGQHNMAMAWQSVTRQGDYRTHRYQSKLQYSSQTSLPPLPPGPILHTMALPLGLEGVVGQGLWKMWVVDTVWWDGSGCSGGNSGGNSGNGGSNSNEDRGPLALVAAVQQGEHVSGRMM